MVMEYGHEFTPLLANCQDYSDAEIVRNHRPKHWAVVKLHIMFSL